MIGAASVASAAAAMPGPKDSTLLSVDYEGLPGWAEDEHLAAFRAFARSCRPIVDGAPAPRAGVPASPGLVAVCRAALTDPPSTADAARRFFERMFQPFLVTRPEGDRGFLTGYYEPEVAGALTAEAAFPWPIYGRPPDLVTVEPGREPGLDPALAGGRRTASGIEPFPDRAAVEAGALAGQGLEIAFVADEVEAFFIHVQGSARLRLRDGAVTRLAYAGRNGHPYASIGRMAVEKGWLTPEEAALEPFKAWLRANPDKALALMRANRSFIFFRRADELAPDDGPIGAASVPLIAGRSLAIDRQVWSYGLPVFVAGSMPSDAAPGDVEIGRLMIAQDTGTAIVGAARGDFFFGSGPAAGERAGRTRHAVRFFVLLPRTLP